MFKYLFKSKDTAHRAVIFSDIKEDNRAIMRFLKRPIAWYILSGFVIVLFTPILVNSLVLYEFKSSVLNIDVPFFTSIASQNNQWVGFFASYSGSIIGGIISGALTLVGVSLTIKQGRIEKMIESYPRKRQAIKELETILENLNKEIHKIYSAKWEGLNNKIPEVLYLILNHKNELIDKASEINGIAYLAVLDLVDKTEEGLGTFSKLGGSLTNEQLNDIFNDVKFFWFGYYSSTKKENDKYKNEMKKIIKKSL